MAKLIYSTISSLDGYVADDEGNFDWAEPDEEVHTFINDFQRDVGTYLYGRRLYEVMIAWETMNTDDQPGHMREFAEIWQGADKIVYSKTLETASTAVTRIERVFDPEAVRQMKAQTQRDLTVGGPELAAHASGRRWLTSATFSWRPSLLEVASSHSPETSASTWSCWTNAVSAVSFTSATASGRETSKASTHQSASRPWQSSDAKSRN